MLILDKTVLTDGEQELVAQHLSQPIVKKYLKSLGLKILEDLAAGAPGAGQSDSEYIRAEAYHKGQLAVIETLYSIK